MSQEKHSWLEGPQIPAASGADLGEQDYPGQFLGMPQTGNGSLVSLLRRVGGVTIDWFLSLGVAMFYGLTFGSAIAPSSLTLLIFVLVGIVSVWAVNRTPGQAVMGMGVVRVDAPEARVGLWRAVVRTLMTAFLLPPLVTDADKRGLHDRATGTAVIRG